MDPSGNVPVDIGCLTIEELRFLCRGSLSLSREERRKASILDAIRTRAPIDLQRRIAEFALKKKESTALMPSSKKRKRVDDTDLSSQRSTPHLQSENHPYTASSSSIPESCPDNLELKYTNFLRVPTEEQVKSSYRAFYEATSNAAVAMFTCGVCGREMSVREDELRIMPLSSLPNSHRLIPRSPHPAHDLFDGKLLEPSGILCLQEGLLSVKVCRQCWRELNHEKDVPPAFSLANNLWIGKVPWELQILTFPEQLLISLLFPRVYVFKLYPKAGHFNFDPSTLQRAMKGTVSTYALDSQSISKMITGRLLPHPPAILASLISVTFIGQGKLPKNWLHSTFRVRRGAVHRALLWLKKNNPKYYGSLEIDDIRLASLPEDGVPVEISAVVRQTTDVGIIDQESAGYVPQDEEVLLAGDGDSTINLVKSVDGLNSYVEGADISSDDGDVIPLYASGTLDMDLSSLTAKETVDWGLFNLWKDNKEGGYAVRHGRRPVRDFPSHNGPNADENYFEKAFPCLFPYGVGGIEAVREIEVDFREHVKWALQYHDRRFRCHETFPFVSFGISQRRQALASARIQMRRRNFEKDATVMSTVTLEKLKHACIEEEKNLPISDPAVRLLRKHVHATAGRVMGSDQARYQLRSQIWSTSIMIAPATVWMTINPTDIHDPIAQVFAGEDIDLDNFVACLGPDADKRAKNIARDPYAAAKFFHFMVRTILETLLGIEVTSFQVKSYGGILGDIAAYFGVVESQGRATLHLHLLICLRHAPSADEMKALLQSESFRSRVRDYIKANFRAYLPGLDSKEHIKNIPREPDIAFNRPPNPDAPDYDEQLKSFELRLARTEQVHTCKIRRCLFPDKNGNYRCKRRAPWPLSEDDKIDENGGWAQKRLYGFVNGWIPGILVNARCNNDGKLLTHGRDTSNVTFYATTTYAVKKQHKSYNMSAILANGYAYHVDQLAVQASAKYVDDIRDHQRLLLFRLVQAVNREQELAAPMVISLLMGWGDSYRSHHYTPIYWSSFVGQLFKSFPELRVNARFPGFHQPDAADLHIESDFGKEDADNDRSKLHEELIDDVEACEAENGNDLVTLDFSSNGQLFMKCQVVDYRLRGIGLSHLNVIEFFTDTYEEEMPRLKVANKSSSLHQASKQRGRPPNSRYSYEPGHPKASTLRRVIRSAGHNNLPNFVGRYFPHRDDSESYPFYCASMLMLLKPWRDVEKDLKQPDESWEQAFNNFMSTPEAVAKDYNRILSGIQYYHDGESSSLRRLDEDEIFFNAIQSSETRNKLDQSHLNQDLELGEDVEEFEGFTERGLADIIAAQVPPNEALHAQLAIEIARRAHIFADDEATWNLHKQNKYLSPATGDDLERLAEWRKQMEADILRQSTTATFATDNQAQSGDMGGVEKLTNTLSDPGPGVQFLDATAEASLTALDPSELRADQRRAFDIVLWHLDQTLAGRNPPPLRMIIQGEGGTGKSKVIQTITKAFAARGVSYMLLKAAYTGIAASLIDGKTTHTIGGISVGSSDEAKMSDETKARLQMFWRLIRYLIIDEYSMLAKDFFALLSRNISIAKHGSPGYLPDMSFGGINVIICGDFHQFPPVARAINQALYYPVNIASDTAETQIGRTIYEEFTTVVTLKEQMRITDPVWHDFLQHLRYGNVQENHLNMLRTLIIGSHNENNIDFDAEPWRSAALVTPRHAVRSRWNESAVRKMCRETGRQLLICTAKDTVKGRPLTLVEKCCLESRYTKGRRRKTKDLPRAVEMAIGMEVMVTNNIETDLDITNGARGEIVDIILHPDEPDIGDAPVVTLKYVPAYILVKLRRTRASILQGLEECVIPVEPASVTYRLKIKTRDGRLIQRTVTRTQFPMTPAYAFTDYRAQGQTLPYVIVDIASPPTGTLTLFNLYVALSRSAGRKTIRLLRDFDDDLFKVPHDFQLLEEDDRLEHLNEDTKQWYRQV